jgi:hypothetical protein
LPEQPLEQIIVRHTVGLSDPLSEGEITPDQRLDDGLPQSLDACIDAYGLTHFKIKLAGEVRRDLERLRGIAALLDRKCAKYVLTLDANESYYEVDPLRQLWLAIVSDSRLRDFAQRLLFVEQPLHRDAALSAGVTRELLAWADRPDMIIDESGGTFEALPDALARGYVGTSHKNCKGVIKGIAAACLVRHRLRQNPAARLVLSAEDLSNTGPVALVQDLAVVAALGIPHAERNGYHYFRGLSGWPTGVQQAAENRFPDLFKTQARAFVTANVSGGELAVKDCNYLGFGLGNWLGLEVFANTGMDVTS